MTVHHVCCYSNSFHQGSGFVFFRNTDEWSVYTLSYLLYYNLVIKVQPDILQKILRLAKCCYITLLC